MPDSHQHRLPNFRHHPEPAFAGPANDPIKPIPSQNSPEVLPSIPTQGSHHQTVETNNLGWYGASDFLDGKDAVHGLDRALDLGGDRVLAGERDVDLAPGGVGNAEGDLGAGAALDFRQESGK